MDNNKKLDEIFNKESNIISTNTHDNNYVVVGKDHNGEDVVVNVDPKGGLQLSAEMIQNINNPDWIKKNQEERERRKELLDNWFSNSTVSGPLAKEFTGGRDLFEIPKEYLHMISTPEDEDDELDPKSRNIIKSARKQSIVVEPDLMKGLSNTLDLAADYKNMTHVVDLMKYAKIKRINWDLIRTSESAMLALYKEWHDSRRPSIPVIMQRLVQECDRLFFNWLDSPSADGLGEDAKKALRRNVSTRVEFIKDMEEESGQKLYGIEDFILLKFQFQEYGLQQEDKIWFNPSTPIPNTNTTMGDYLKEFQERTRWDFVDVYTHYWKEVEKETAEPADDTIEQEVSLVEGKENEKNILVSNEPDLLSRMTDPGNMEIEINDEDFI